MNGKHYIGKRASSLELYDEIGPITGVALIVDDKNKCFAGDESGYVLTAECPYATDQMAADALAKVQGKTYLGYRSTDTVLPVDAELGDGVTVGGIYSLLAYRKVSFGPGHMSEISAPGENEVDHEYPYVSSTKRETDRKLAQTRSEITKTSKAITQRVEDVEGAMSEFNVSLESLSGRVEEAEGKATEAALRLDGFTVTTYNEDGSVASVKLADGTVTADNIVAGAITGDKISAETEISAPKIIGGSILDTNRVARLRLIYDEDASGVLPGLVFTSIISTGAEADIFKVIPLSANASMIGVWLGDTPLLALYQDGKIRPSDAWDFSVTAVFG